MSALTISIDKNFPISFDGFLFNDPELIKAQSSDFHTFYLSDQQKAFARFILFVNKDQATSPLRAPFGSIEFNQELKFEDLKVLIGEVEKFCKEKKIKSLSIVSYPFCYATANSQMLTWALMDEGYEITTSDLNFHLEVTEKGFEENLHESEKRRLKKCEKEKFQLKTEDFPDTDEMFELIKLNREQKGFPISMKADELKKLFKTYPGKYFAFTLRDKNKLIASSIGVRVNSKILYYFLPAADVSYKNFSPGVIVLKEMYEFCQKNHYENLDLGIATAGGVPNPGLIRFKQNLGALSSLKLSFKKEFN